MSKESTGHERLSCKDIRQRVLVNYDASSMNCKQTTSSGVWAAMAIMLTIAGCSKAKEVSKPKEASLPYRSASASEVFKLRSECASLTQQINNDSDVGPALLKTAVSHYNAKTNRCYGEITVAPVDGKPGYASYLYDGQTREMLAYYREEAGHINYNNFKLPLSDDPNERMQPESVQVLHLISATMEDDRKS
jgi:hypothetical protein